MTTSKAEAPSSDLTTAYDRYAAASAAHAVIWGNPETTASERFDSAMAVHTAFHEFLMTNAKADAA